MTTYTIVSVCTETPDTLQCTATFLFAATPSLSSNVDSKCTQHRFGAKNFSAFLYTSKPFDNAVYNELFKVLLGKNGLVALVMLLKNW